MLPQDLTTLIGATDGKAYVGFTSGTAAESAHHDILSWRFTSTNGQRDTVGVFRPPTTGTPKGAYYLRNSNSSGPADITAWLDFANNVNEVPVVGDWNGDGIDTVGVYNRSNGIYELVNANANAATAAITAAYGSPNSWPVIGDWNGDGVDTFAVYNPTTSSWLFSNNPNNAAPSTTGSTTYGMSEDIPVSGDWDGDGVDTMGIFRPSSGQWHLTNTRITMVNQTPPTVSLISYGSPFETGNTLNGAWVPGLKSGLGLRRGIEFSLKNQSGVGNGPVDIDVVVGADTAFDYGQVGDAPVAGRWAQGPTSTPSSNPCDVILNSPSKFRVQPFLDSQYPPSLDPMGENWIFTIPQSGTFAVSGANIANRPLLWKVASIPPLLAVPSQFQIVNITALARLNAQQSVWVHPTTNWLQIRTRILNSDSVYHNIVGYIQEANVSITQPCPLPNSLLNDNQLLDTSVLPTYSPRKFNTVNQPSIFGELPPAVMGSCFIHDGINFAQSCGPGIDNPLNITIDIVPRNIEQCTDSRAPIQRGSECDPDPALNTGNNARIPVYSPINRPSCAFFVEQSRTVVIAFDPDLSKDIVLSTNNCNAVMLRAYPNGSQKRYEVSITHVKVNQAGGPNLIPSVNLPTYLPINAGTRIGFMCRRSEWINRNPNSPQTDHCGNLDTTAPSHLAVSLREYSPSSALIPATNDEIKGFLAAPICIYDNWKYTENNLLQQQDPVTAINGCP